MPVPAITVAQMREWEKATWASGQTEDAVMQCAGQAVARFAQTLTSAGDSIVVLAGKGHNGEDAKYAAHHASCVETPFTHPRTDRLLSFESPIPKDMSATLRALVAGPCAVISNQANAIFDPNGGRTVLPGRALGCFHP